MCDQWWHHRRSRVSHRASQVIGRPPLTWRCDAYQRASVQGRDRVRRPICRSLASVPATRLHGRALERRRRFRAAASGCTRCVWQPSFCGVSEHAQRCPGLGARWPRQLLRLPPGWPGPLSGPRWAMSRRGTRHAAPLITFRRVINSRYCSACCSALLRVYLGNRRAVRAAFELCNHRAQMG